MSSTIIKSSTTQTSDEELVDDFEEEEKNFETTTEIVEITNVNTLSYVILMTCVTSKYLVVVKHHIGLR